MKLICLIILQLNLFSGEINKAIREFKGKAGNEGINISVSVRSLNSGTEVYTHFSEMNLPPASTLKLLTTATAFEYLSGKYKIETMIYANGRVSNRKILGDLLLEGVGDPSFGSSRFKENPFEQILKTLKDYDVTVIEGGIKILNNDKTKFPLTWLITDIGNYYGAFSNNFNFNENIYNVYFNGAAKEGEPAQITNIYPHDKSWKIRNEVKTGPAGSGDKVNILNLPYSNDILMLGTVPLNARNFTVKGAVPNVNQIFTDSLTNYLKKNGITVNGKLFPDNLQNEEMGSILSPDVQTIAKETNFKSVNIFADGLANFMWEPEANSYEEFIKMFWKEKGLDLSGHTILDGSGLAPQNTFSSKSMTSLLYKMRNNTEFIGTLPVLGRDGTVASLGKTTQGKIQAKSGSIGGTRNYSGYFTGLSGKKYAFSIFINGFTADQSKNVRAFIDGFFTKMLSIRE